jgi:uncharacterized membrane protein
MKWLYKSWQKKILFTLATLAGLGFIDSTYLTYEKLTGSEVACTILAGCNTVINSEFASLFGLPLAYLGLLYYIFLAILINFTIKNNKIYWLQILTLTTLSGFFMSGYFVYLQLFEIGSICIYCMASALTSTLLFILTSIIYFTKKRAAI